MYYVKSADGVVSEGWLRSLPSEYRSLAKEELAAVGWFEYVDSSPKCECGQCCICKKLVRCGDHFTGVYDVVDFASEEKDEELTDADKDEALRGFGVEVTE